MITNDELHTSDVLNSKKPTLFLDKADPKTKKFMDDVIQGNDSRPSAVRLKYENDWIKLGTNQFNSETPIVGTDSKLQGNTINNNFGSQNFNSPGLNIVN